MVCSFLVAAALAATPTGAAWRPLLTADLDGWTASLGPAEDDPRLAALDPGTVFQVESVRGEPVLRIDGHRFGALVSDAEFEGFHLRAEFRWGEAHHSDRPWRDAGLVYHSFGEPRSVRSGVPARFGLPAVPGPLVDPGTGSFLEGLEYHVVAAVNRATHAAADDAVGDLGWFGRCGADLVERAPAPQRPAGIWNRIEIRAHGDEAIHLLNGTVVAVASGLRRFTDGGETPLLGGRLQLQSSGDEIFWRRLEVRPIEALFDQEGDSWAQRFERSRRKALQAYTAGRNEEALRRYRDIELLPPIEGVLEAYEYTAYARRARVLARLGRFAEAFETTERAIRYGWHDAEEIRDAAEFVPVRDDERHQQLIRMAHAHAVDDLPAHVPNAARGGPAPLLIAFHGRSGIASGFLQSWIRAADALGWAVVAPRSPFVDPQAFGRAIWDAEVGPAGEGPTGIDLPMASALAERAIERAEAEGVVVDRDRIVLAGYGQGGAVALRLLVESPGRYAGAYAIGTRYEPLGADRWAAAAAARPVAVTLLMGRADPRRETLDAARRELGEAGVRLRVIDLPGLGHERPLDHGAAWVGGVKSEWPTDHVARQVDALGGLVAPD